MKVFYSDGPVGWDGESPSIFLAGPTPRREDVPSWRPQALEVLAGLGFTGGGIHLGLQWLGLHYTTATSGVLFLSTAPIFVLLMAAPILTERIGLPQWAGVAISFCGVAARSEGATVVRSQPGNPTSRATISPTAAISRPPARTASRTAPTRLRRRVSASCSRARRSSTSAPLAAFSF